MDWVVALQRIETSASIADPQWIKRHRKIDTMKLITCMLTCLQRKASIKSIIDTIDSCDFTHTAYMKALSRCSDNVFRSVYRHLTGPSRRSRVLAVDGSRIPLTKSQTGTMSGRTRSIPTGLLSSVYDVNNKSIVDLDFSDHYDERAALRRMLSSVKAGDTLVMDRGYYSDELAHLLYEQGIKFVFRLKDNIGIKTFKPAGKNVYRTGKGTPVAVTYYHAGGTQFRILHSLRIPSGKAKNIYKQRWDVEEAFKALKCTIKMNASHLRKNAKITFKKQMWICACLHFLQRRVMVHKEGAHKQYNGVQVVQWLIYKLGGGKKDHVRLCKMYSVTGDRRLRQNVKQTQS